MSLITGNLRKMVKVPASNLVTIRAVLFPVIVGNALIVPDTIVVPANPVGEWMQVLDQGGYEISVTGLSGAIAKVTITVPDDDNTYSFDELVVSSLPIPSAPIGGAQPTASPSVLGIVKTDDAVATPIAATGWFYRETAAAARSTITNPANTAGAQNNKVLLVQGSGIFYQWDAESTGADDGTETTAFVRLSDTGLLEPGRFMAVTGGLGGGGGTPPAGGAMLFGSGDPSGVVDAPLKTWFRDVPGKALYLNTSGGAGGWEPITG